VYTILAEFMRAGETVALATVIRVRGSVPREVGARMIVHPHGRHAGTVGGGCGEAAVIRTALDVLASGRPAIVSVDLTGEVTMESPAICGGVMDVFVERLPSPHFTLDDLQPLLDAAERRQRIALATVVAAPGEHSDIVGRKAVIWPGRELSGSLGRDDLETIALNDIRQALEVRQHFLVCYAQDELASSTRMQCQEPLDATGSELLSHYAQGTFCVFTEVQQRPPSLVIVGAGHIARPLAQMAQICDFTVTVLDDRAQFANSRRFPDADDVIVGPMPECLRQIPLDDGTFVVLITRGHQHDVDCLLQILDAPLAYVGMIGSRRRVRGVITLLEQEKGIPRAKLKRVFAPIGLDIGARTPAEIALTIMAEVIKVYRGGAVPSLSDEWRDS